MDFEIIETVDSEDTPTGVMLILDGKIVDWFPHEGAAVAHALNEFTFNLMKAVNGVRKSSSFVFEREGHRVIEVRNGANTEWLVVDPEGNLVPRSFGLEEAVSFIEEKLSIKFGRRQ